MHGAAFISLILLIVIDNLCVQSLVKKKIGEIICFCFSFLEDREETQEINLLQLTPVNSQRLTSSGKTGELTPGKPY